MLSVTIFALAFAVGGATPPASATACWATDYAPSSLTILAEPSTKANPVRSISRTKVRSFVRVDGFNDHSRDWLEIRVDGVEGWVPVKYVVCRLSPSEAQGAVEQEASEIVQALKKKDMPSVAAYVHPIKGLRVSPYASVDRKVNPVLSSAEVKSVANSPGKRTWGIDDGSGAPIQLSFSRYYGKFVYDRDFAAAPKVTYNVSAEDTRKAWEEFPSAVVVNYGFPESGKNPEDHLLLAFEQDQGKWYLTAIIHSGWTI